MKPREWGIVPHSFSINLLGEIIMSGLNPQIRTTEIGTKQLRTITIYPLSLADQFSVSEIFAEGMLVYEESTKPTPVFVDGEPATDNFGNEVVEPVTEFDEVQVIVELIEKNLLKIVNMVIDDDEAITLRDLTNNQFADLCSMLYEENYGTAVGKFQALISRVKSSFQQKKSSPKSLQSLATGTNTSSDSATETAE